MKKVNVYINQIINKLDSKPLWIWGFILELIVFIPYIYLKDRSVFIWHDQLDENLLTYYFTAKHFGDGMRIFPEMMGGTTASALQPFSFVFTFLYMFLPPLVAFVIQYATVFAIAFWGMYFCAMRFSKSNLISMVCASFFAMLPFFPVYGAAVAGIPMAILGIVYFEEKKPVKAYACLLLFTLTSHLVFTGYCVLGFWGLFLLYKLARKKCNKDSVIGFFIIIIVYVAINYQLFMDVFFNYEGFVSHRTEFVLHSINFLDAVKIAFFDGSQHSDACNRYLILPIVILLLTAIIFRKRLNNDRGLISALLGLLMIILITFAVAFFKGDIFTNWRNAQSGALKSFQIDRFSWLLPALWWLEAGMTVAVWWNSKLVCKCRIFGVLIILLMFLPSFKLVVGKSYFYMSIDQMLYKSVNTGYITWKGLFSDDVMAEIDAAIGREKTDYRVAHIGIDPASSLLYGFYTVDGYAGSYSLEYKHKFREVIADELDNSPELKQYFDEWGSRCYLFNGQVGTGCYIGKYWNAKFNNLSYDYDKLKTLGADYIFSCGEIEDFSTSGLDFIGNFTSDTSFWSIWVYKIL